MLKQKWSWTDMDFGHLSCSIRALNCLFPEISYYTVRKISPIYLRHYSQGFLSLECVSHLVVSDSLRPPRTVALRAPQSVRFSRQEYWSGLPFPSPGDLPDPGIEPSSHALWADSLP